MKGFQLVLIQTIESNLDIIFQLHIGHLIIGLPIEFSACLLFVFASPLLEEEGDFGLMALFLNI
jgi:hypothetical protein